MSTLLTSDAIVALTQEVWTALLSSASIPLVQDDVVGEDVVAIAEITGEWNGIVCLSCSQAAARHATAGMFEMADDEITEEEIVDAVGELVNVVGGNIKSLVPGPSVLSIPRVQHGQPADLPSHLDLALEVRFAWMAEPLVVSVWSDEVVTAS